MQPLGHNQHRIGALDGLRGVAVAGVLAYHAGFGWARGGFLGVSLFFTLSGFLITSLLLAERDGTGRVSLRGFWVRRARRLLPAALVALAGIVAFGATIATASQLRDLRGDVVGALAYVANWRFVLAGSSYGDLWSAPSPVQHFWSLAIEEQLYVVLPLAVTGALAIGRGRRRVVAGVLVALLGASVVATFAVHDQLRAYYGTDVRAAELLAGALLAVAVTVRRVRVPSAVGLAALGALLAAWATTTQTDWRLYRGGLLVHAALVVAVIAAARADGPLASVLGARPLRWLGRISYGAYLYHWPLFLWLTEARTGLGGVPLAAVRIGVSLAAAWVSAALLEEPVRAGRRLVRTAPLALGATALAIGVAVVTVTSAIPPPAIGVDLDMASGLVAPTASFPSTSMIASSRSTTSAPLASTSTTATSPTTAPRALRTSVPLAPGEPLRVYVAGDSNAFILGLKLLRWGEQHHVQVWASGWFACHIVPGGTYRWAGQPKHTEDKCNDWAITRAQEIQKIRPHVVLVIYGSFDLLDRQWDGSDEWTHVGRPDFDRALVDNIAKMTDILGSEGARVVWAMYPRTRTGIIDGKAPPVDHPETAEYRVDRLNTLIRQVVAARPFADVLELRRYMQAWPNGELDPERRPDGIHPSDDQAEAIAQWMALQLLRDVSWSPDASTG
jgi:peptidoglycan/LPS O-acetylase OafA/YrhL